MIKRLINLLAMIFSIPVYIILGSIVVLMFMLEGGINGVIRVFNLWYDTFVEEL